MPTALFIFAFTGAYRHVRWMGPVISGVVFGFTMILLHVSANSYIIDSYSNYAATATAAKTLRDRCHGPTIREPHVPQHGLPLRGAIVSASCIGDSPIPFMFFKYGERVRARSKRASKNQGIRDEPREPCRHIKRYHHHVRIMPSSLWHWSRAFPMVRFLLAV